MVAARAPQTSHRCSTAHEWRRVCRVEQAGHMIPAAPPRVAEAQVHPLALGMATRGDRGEFVTFRDGSAVAMDLRVQRSLELFDAEGIYDARQGYELAAEVLEGDSGSVMVVDGKAAGVIFARSSGHAERAFAIDIAEAADLLAVDDDERADTGACVPDRH